MKRPVFTGAAVAIITPMNTDGSVNYDELGRIIDDQIAHSTDAIVICGTTGESRGAYRVHPLYRQKGGRPRPGDCGYRLQRHEVRHLAVPAG